MGGATMKTIGVLDGLGPQAQFLAEAAVRRARMSVPGAPARRSHVTAGPGRLSIPALPVRLYDEGTWPRAVVKTRQLEGDA
jgi:hypothetical protein